MTATALRKVYDHLVSFGQYLLEQTRVESWRLGSLSPSMKKTSGTLTFTPLRVVRHKAETHRNRELLERVSTTTRVDCSGDCTVNIGVGTGM